MAHKVWWPIHLNASSCPPSRLVLFTYPRSCRRTRDEHLQSKEPYSHSPSGNHMALHFYLCPLSGWPGLFDSCLPSSPLPWPFLSSSSSWTMQAEWKCKSHSLLKHLSQGGSMSPIFMSFKWLLSKWGRTKSHRNCHKYKWLDIGCNKPSGKIIWCAVAVMVYHTGSSYISTGKVIRSFRGL